MKNYLLNIATSFLLLFILCLGTQNISKRYQLNIGISKTVTLPIGFILGISFISGYVYGGQYSFMVRDK